MIISIAWVAHGRRDLLPSSNVSIFELYLPDNKASEVVRTSSETVSVPAMSVKGGDKMRCVVQRCSAK